MWNLKGGGFFFRGFGGGEKGRLDLSQVHIKFLEVVKFTVLDPVPWYLLLLFLFVTIEQPKLVCLIV